MNTNRLQTWAFGGMLLVVLAIAVVVITFNATFGEQNRASARATMGAVEAQIATEVYATLTAEHQ